MLVDGENSAPVVNLICYTGLQGFRHPKWCRILCCGSMMFDVRHFYFGICKSHDVKDEKNVIITVQG